MYAILHLARLRRGLTFVGSAQQPTMPTKFGESQPSANPNEAKRKEMFEAKVKVEWEALKNKDKKVYGELLAEDYQGVEVDGKGERNKIQALNELVETNVANYTLWGLSVIPVGEDAALIDVKLRSGSLCQGGNTAVAGVHQ